MHIAAECTRHMKIVGNLLMLSWGVLFSFQSKNTFSYIFRITVVLSIQFLPDTMILSGAQECSWLSLGKLICRSFSIFLSSCMKSQAGGTTLSVVSSGGKGLQLMVTMASSRLLKWEHL